MGVESVHPDYGTSSDDWRQMRDTYAGQRTIKQGGFLYLRPTQSQVIDGALKAIEPGYSAYQNYLSRALFPEHVRDAAQTFVGILNRESPEISLPARLEPILENATRQNESLEQLLRRIHEAQLVYGRNGLLLDVDADSELPHIVTYSAEAITNWDDQRASESQRDQLQFVVTTEDAWVRGAEANQMFDWNVQTRYRAMYLGEDGLYQTFIEQDGLRGPEVTPAFAGQPLPFVPWTFIGATDLQATPGTIPLLGLSNAALSIYRGEADLRQTLHMLGQDTLVMIGVAPGTDLDEDEPTRIGSGAKLELPEGGDAKFIGISGTGLTEQRLTITEDYARSIAMGSRLLENTSSQAESGEALRIRVAAKTTTLQSVALTAAAGLENALKQMAVWVGADPAEVRVSPNLDFTEEVSNPEQALKLVEARNAGLPISLQSIHEWASKNEFTQKTFEQELELMREDSEIIETIQGGAPGAPEAQPVEVEVEAEEVETVEQDEEEQE